MTDLRISRRAADRLRAGHLWIYRSDIESELTSGIEPGALVSVRDGRNAPLGTALYSSSSQIAARLVSREAGLSREQYLETVRDRVLQALVLRRVIAPTSSRDNAQRLIFAEADELPGIVVDRYNDFLVLQLLTQGTAQNDVRAIMTQSLRDEFATEVPDLTIWERQDSRIRELEQLAVTQSEPLFAAQNDGRTTTEFQLNGLRFSYDVGAGQKTGAFLDQRQNYAAAARWIAASERTGRALDICTYQGGFALHLAQVCAQVTGVDQSRSALEAADRNLALNPDLKAEVNWIEADAFDLLRALDDARGATRGKQALPVSPIPAFDAIVLDPPAFAKSKRAAEGAMRGYKELNLRAMRLLAPGGTLITCSCSHHVSLEDFTAAVCSAAADAGRRVQLLETRAAAPDHPELLTLPETRYLKCLICRVD